MKVSEETQSGFSECLSVQPECPALVGNALVMQQHNRLSRSVNKTEVVFLVEMLGCCGGPQLVHSEKVLGPLFLLSAVPCLRGDSPVSSHTSCRVCMCE